MGGWLENWRVMLISAFNYVIVEVVAEIGNKTNSAFVKLLYDAYLENTSQNIECVCVMGWTMVRWWHRYMIMVTKMILLK